MWAKKWEKSTIFRYCFAQEYASAVTFAPPHQPRTASMLNHTSGGRTRKNRSLKAIICPRRRSHAVRFP